MNRKQPLLLALSAAMVIGTSAPAFAAEATDAATREDVISLLWQQEGAPALSGGKYRPVCTQPGKRFCLRY